MSLAEKAKGHFDNACAYLQRGNVPEAVNELSQAIAIDLKPEYYFHRAHLYLQLGDCNKAAADLNRAEQLVKEQPAGDLTPSDIQHLRAQITSRASSHAPSMNRQALERYAHERRLQPLLNDMGFGAQIAQLTHLARPSYRLKPTGGSASLGSCKIGGYPDLPPKFEWPRTKGAVPMAFVCQINLAEIAQKDRVGGLPPAGMLYLFYDTTAIRGRQQGEFALICRDATEHLMTIHAPDGTPQENSFFEAAVSVSREECLPDFDAPQMASLLKPEMRQAYEDLLRIWYGPTPWHRVLGWSQGIQACVEKQLPGGKLLVQLDSDPNCCMEWGDTGRLFAVVRDVQPVSFDPANLRVFAQSY